MSTEIWQDIAGYEGLYRVSNWGQVQSLHRRGRLLAQTNGRRGYKRVHLSVKGCANRYFVHRLVALAFIPNPLQLDTVNHKDFDKANNRVDNLEWMTIEDNVRHAYPQRAERFVVDKELARHIFICYYTGNESMGELAESIGISASCVQDVVQRITWMEATKDLMHLIPAATSDACARSRGVKRAYADGRLQSRRGQNNNMTKLTETQVLEIRTTYADGGVSYNELAKRYRVCADTIRQIVKRWIWAHVSEGAIR